MLEIFNPGKFILSFYSTEVKRFKTKIQIESIAIAGLLLFPFARGVKKLRPAAKVEKEGTSDLQQRGAVEPFSSCQIDAT